MGIYKVCPYCGARLDPGEPCDCIAARYDALSTENRARLEMFAMELMAEQRASAGR